MSIVFPERRKSHIQRGDTTETDLDTNRVESRVNIDSTKIVGSVDPSRAGSNSSVVVNNRGGRKMSYFNFDPLNTNITNHIMTKKLNNKNNNFDHMIDSRDVGMMRDKIMNDIQEAI